MLEEDAESKGKAFGQKFIGIVAKSDVDEFMGGLYGYMIQGRFSLEELVVDKNFRGMGVGKRLLEHLEALLQSRDVPSIYLGTWDFQAPGFYEKMGYQLFARLPEIEGFPSKGWYQKAL